MASMARSPNPANPAAHSVVARKQVVQRNGYPHAGREKDGKYRRVTQQHMDRQDHQHTDRETDTDTPTERQAEGEKDICIYIERETQTNKTLIHALVSVEEGKEGGKENTPGDQQQMDRNTPIMRIQ